MNTRRSSRRTPGMFVGFWTNSAYAGFFLTAALFTTFCLVFPVIIPALATAGWFCFSLMAAAAGARLGLATMNRMNLATESKLASAGVALLGFALGFTAAALGLHFMPLLPYTLITLGAAGVVASIAGSATLKTITAGIKNLFGLNKKAQLPPPGPKLDFTLDPYNSLESGNTVTTGPANSRNYDADLSTSPVSRVGATSTTMTSRSLSTSQVLHTLNPTGDVRSIGDLPDVPTPPAMSPNSLTHSIKLPDDAPPLLSERVKAEAAERDAPRLTINVIDETQFEKVERTSPSP